MKLKLIYFFAAVVTMLVLSVTANAAYTHDYSVQSGTYSSAQLVFITPYEGVDLYFTTDGSLPDDSSAPVTCVPVTVVDNTRIRCAAYIDGVLAERSEVDLKIRTVAPKASLDGGCYAEPVSVRLTCADKNAEIYYTTDGSVPSKKAQRYTKPITISKDTTLKFITYKKGCTYSKYVTKKYTIGAEYADKELQELFTLINDLRRNNGLCELAEMPELSELAQQRAEECAVLCSHYRPDGTKWDYLLAQHGLNRSVRAENLAYWYDTPESAFAAWYDSYYHRVNMLNADARYIGIGHYVSGYNHYWVLLFLGEE